MTGKEVVIPEHGIFFWVNDRMMKVDPCGSHRYFIETTVSEPSETYEFHNIRGFAYTQYCDITGLMGKGRMGMSMILRICRSEQIKLTSR